jgi:hypothetical protein
VFTEPTLAYPPNCLRCGKKFGFFCKCGACGLQH